MSLRRLLPDGPEGTPVFKTRAELEKFRREFYEAIKPALERHRRARVASNKWAKSKFVT